MKQKPGEGRYNLNASREMSNYIKSDPGPHPPPGVFSKPGAQRAHVMRKSPETEELKRRGKVGRQASLWPEDPSLPAVR